MQKKGKKSPHALVYLDRGRFKMWPWIWSHLKYPCGPIWKEETLHFVLRCCEHRELWMQLSSSQIPSLYMKSRTRTFEEHHPHLSWAMRMLLLSNRSTFSTRQQPEWVPLPWYGRLKKVPVFQRHCLLQQGKCEVWKCQAIALFQNADVYFFPYVTSVLLSCAITWRHRLNSRICSYLPVILPWERHSGSVNPYCPWPVTRKKFRFSTTRYS